MMLLNTSRSCSIRCKTCTESNVNEPVYLGFTMGYLCICIAYVRSTTLMHDINIHIKIYQFLYTTASAHKLQIYKPYRTINTRTQQHKTTKTSTTHQPKPALINKRKEKKNAHENIHPSRLPTTPKHLNHRPKHHHNKHTPTAQHPPPPARHRRHQRHIQHLRPRPQPPRNNRPHPPSTNTPPIRPPRIPLGR